MAQNPLNLALRFILELAAWGSMGYWGFTQARGLMRWLVGIGLPLLAMALWGTFRVDGDPKDAPVAVPGLVRLGLEALTFGLAAYFLFDAAPRPLALAFTVIVLIHYLISYDRVLWLVKVR